MTCKATIEQGAKKGTQCVRTAQENGYCGKHQSHAQISQGKEQGLKKCKRHRCNIMVITSETYCQGCIAKKEEENKSKNFCNAKIDQGVRKGQPCGREAGESGYCGKHEGRHTLLDIARASGNRLCDDAKRGCHNLVKDGFSKCEGCLEKDRQYENGIYHVRKEAGNLCVICGIIIQEKVKHATHTNYLNKCEPCINKMREIESNRVRENRNYKEEYIRNDKPYYKLYLRMAIKRNLDFCISRKEFSALIREPCFYCDTYNENESVGIDRIDSNKGYYIYNIVPCCEGCNKKKGIKQVTQFMKEYNETNPHKLDIIKEYSEKSKALPQKVTIQEIVDTWNENKEIYINQWKQRNYSQAFLEAVNVEEITKEILDEELYNEGVRSI